MKHKIPILLMIGILSLTLVIAQGVIRFPNSFEITIPELSIQQSNEQLIFGCPYDQNIEYRMVGVRNLTWNGDLPTVTADVKFWTKDRTCAGSKRFELDLPLTLNQQSLVNNFQTQVNAQFLAEAQANHQRTRSSNNYIAGSSAVGIGI